jgi:hypothetical protein
MPMPDVHVQSRRLARQSAACSSRGIGALRPGRVLLMIGGLCCCALSLLAQTSDSTMTDQRNNSWTATTDSKGNNLNPTRIIESHSQSGNRTLDERSVQVRGSGGHFEPYQDIERETLQVDATTIRTTTRTFARDVNGRKTLVQITEEEKRTLPGGDSNAIRITSNPDVNGKLQAVQRDIVETKRASTDVEETKTTVMLPSVNGGLAPAFKTHELRKRSANNTIESQKTTLLPDGAGNWQVNEVRQVTTSQEGTNRTTEERVSRLDSKSKLGEVSHVVSTESEGSSGEKRNVVETYSIDVPGTTRDGSLHLVERKTNTESSSSTGARTTQQQVEQINPGEPGAGLRVSVLVDGRMVPGSSGEQSTVTIRERDLNGNVGIVSVDTTKSDRIPTIRIQQTPSEQPK